MQRPLFVCEVRNSLFPNRAEVAILAQPTKEQQSPPGPLARQPKRQALSRPILGSLDRLKS